MQFVFTFDKIKYTNNRSNKTDVFIRIIKYFSFISMMCFGPVAEHLYKIGTGRCQYFKTTNFSVASKKKKIKTKK